jgi:hypothetical protein
MGNQSNDEGRHYDRGRDDRRYYRDEHRGRGHAYGHRKHHRYYRD